MPKDPFAQEYQRVLVKAVKETFTQQNLRTVYPLEKAFERVGCTCHPARARLAKLREEEQAKRVAIQKEFNAALDALMESPLLKEIKELQQEVLKIDREEHPGLDTAARNASPFVALWAIELITAGDLSVVQDPLEDVMEDFTKAWLAGWRPTGISGNNHGPAKET